MTSYRYTESQRRIARAVVRADRGWKAWSAANGIVSREMTRDELNQAITDLKLQLDVLIALRHAKQLPIWDRTTQGWVGVAKAARPVDRNSVDTIRQDARLDALEKRVKALEIHAGLRFGDPEELAEVGNQHTHVEYEYKAFKQDNPDLP